MFAQLTDQHGNEATHSNAVYIDISSLIIYMKKLLDSDWLRTVQFKCNTSAKSVTPVQITPHNSDYD